MEKGGSDSELQQISDTQQETTKSEEFPECDLTFKEQCKIVWEGLKKGFKYDGCTAVPDFNFGSDCCGEHDYYYQSKEITRAEADERLRLCIQKKGYTELAWIYWTGTRILGWLWWRRRPKIPIVQVEEDRPILPQ